VSTSTASDEPLLDVSSGDGGRGVGRRSSRHGAGVSAVRSVDDDQWPAGVDGDRGRRRQSVARLVRVGGRLVAGRTRTSAGDDARHAVPVDDQDERQQQQREADGDTDDERHVQLQLV